MKSLAPPADSAGEELVHRPFLVLVVHLAHLVLEISAESVSFQELILGASSVLIGPAVSWANIAWRSRDSGPRLAWSIVVIL